VRDHKTPQPSNPVRAQVTNLNAAA